MVKSNYILIGFIFLALLASLSLVISDLVILSPASFNHNQEITSIYNITINNTAEGGTTAGTNITQVNITFPAGWTISASTNGSNTNSNPLTISGTTLSWTNTTLGLILNGTLKYFWVNVTSNATPGYYNITIKAVRNGAAAGTNTTYIAVRINDTSSPTITITGPLNGNNYTSIALFNITATDNGAMIGGLALDGSPSVNGSCWGTLNNGVIFKMLKTAGTSAANFALTNTFNATNSSIKDGTYTLNVTCNDSVNNMANVSSTFKIDTTAPVVTTLTPAAAFAKNYTTTEATYMDITFNVSDALTELSSCTLYLLGNGVSFPYLSTVDQTSASLTVRATSLLPATYTYNVNCTDSVGNVGNSTETTFIITPASAGQAPSGGGTTTSTTTTSSWSTMAAVSDSQFSAGYSNSLATNQRLSFSVGSQTHYAGVSALNASTATLTVTSTPQQATVNIGDTKKFELTGDTYYDLSVTLNSIENNKANITIKSINELVVTPSSAGNGTTGTTAGNETETAEVAENMLQSTTFWIVLVVIVIIVIVIIFLLTNKKRYYKKGY